MPIENIGPDDGVAALNETWPDGSEPIKQGDDHIRNIKKAVKNQQRLTPNPNLLINGDFNVFQRYSHNQTIPIGLATACYVDRWGVRGTAGWHGVGTVRTAVSGLGARVMMIAVSTEGTDLLNITQKIEMPEPRLFKNSDCTFHCGFVSAVATRASVSLSVKDASDGSLITSVETGPFQVVGGRVVQTLHIPDWVSDPFKTYYLEVAIAPMGSSRQSMPVGFVNFLMMKLELGSIETPFVPDDPATNLAKCQRYFYRYFGGQQYSSPISNTGYTSWLTLNLGLPVTMRLDTIPLTDIVFEREGAGTFDSTQVVGGNTARFISTDSSAGGYFRVSAFNADAEL